MSTPLRIGLAGLGTVGTGVVKILQSRAAQIAAQCGRPLQLVAVTARDKAKDRGIRIADHLWADSPRDLFTRDDIDVVVEVIGGSDGIAAELVEQSLRAGKAVVTANKALLSKNGLVLAQLAEEKHAPLLFEAAVAGGLPVIKTIREALAANDITRLMGILNGSTNTILTMMALDGSTYEQAIDEANARGYLEADPSLDLDGWDAAHKLAILMTLSFGQWCPLSGLTVRGIRDVSKRHLELARQAGGTIKLVGRAEKTNDGVWGGVMPCFVPEGHRLYPIWRSLNALQIGGDQAGDIFLSGAGAGEGPTASAVVGDLIDLGRGGISARGPVFGLPAAKMTESDLLMGLTEAEPALLVLEKQSGALQPAQLLPHLSALGLQPKTVHTLDGACAILLPPMPQPRQFNYGATMQVEMPDLVATIYPFVP